MTMVMGATRWGAFALAALLAAGCTQQPRGEVVSSEVSTTKNSVTRTTVVRRKSGYAGRSVTGVTPARVAMTVNGTRCEGQVTAKLSGPQGRATVRTIRTGGRVTPVGRGLKPGRYRLDELDCLPTRGSGLAGRAGASVRGARHFTVKAGLPVDLGTFHVRGTGTNALGAVRVAVRQSGGTVRAVKGTAKGHGVGVSYKGRTVKPARTRIVTTVRRR